MSLSTNPVRETLEEHVEARGFSWFKMDYSALGGGTEKLSKFGLCSAVITVVGEDGEAKVLFGKDAESGMIIALLPVGSGEEKYWMRKQVGEKWSEGIRVGMACYMTS